MSLRLRKKAPALWQGNGFGRSTATWLLADHPGWVIYEAGGYWHAKHDDGRHLSGFIHRRADFLEWLEPQLLGDNR